MQELRDMLLARQYRPRVINAAFQKVMEITRPEALKKVERQPTEKITMVTTYDPRLVNMSAVVHKHFRTLITDPHMKDVFGNGIQVAYKRYRNIREFLCRAKLHEKPDRRNPPRLSQRGWKRCNRCTTCAHSENMTSFEISATKERIAIDHTITCRTCPVLYVVECKRCQDRPQYVGKTKRSLQVRGREHINNVEKRRIEGEDRSTPKMYKHFTTNGHSSQDMLMYAIEQVFGDNFTLEARERHYITKLDTVRKGLNS